MKTILDLPPEIHPLIAEHLTRPQILSCILVCRSFHASFTACLWADVVVKPFIHQVEPSVIRANAHFDERLAYPAVVTEKHYTTVDCPRLRELRFYTYSGPFASMTDSTVRFDRTVGSEVHDSQGPINACKLHQVAELSPSQQKAHFARQHSHIRKLTFCHRNQELKEFWKVVGAEWKELEELDMAGVVDEDSVNTFWRVCSGYSGGRGSRGVRHLRFTGILFLGGDLAYLSTLSFERLESLAIVKYFWASEPYRYQMWPLALLERVLKTSRGLRRLEWHIPNIPFPVQIIQDALAEGCWPDLSELMMKDRTCSEEDMVEILELLSLQRLTALDVHGGRGSHEFGWLLFNCLREMQCFDHLRELDVGKCAGVSSMMAQEVLMECAHLVILEVPFVFVRDIVTASKPWGCLRLERLVVYIAKQDGDEAEWEERVFEQISRLRRMRILYLERYPYGVNGIKHLMTLNLRPLSLPSSAPIDINTVTNNSNSQDSDGNDIIKTTIRRGDGGRNSDNSVHKSGGIGCLSSLVQLQEFTFDDGQQRLGMEEAMWMTEHWQDLVCIRGTFKGVGEGDDVKRLKCLFAARGIKYFS
ncbi:hypothetical protein KI688_001782 [Linnemannia hyalina]|uniref:F-box domain-containing protein n=1 Tax=Linnemannia hyalina TaxID=64524 RepID=A0A9P7XQX1_9FUNG|nr:hypothetical protein KI688_001782 [Linnemannia hyalina]